MEMDKLVTLLDLCPSNSSHSTNLRLLCQVAFLSLKGAAMDSCMNRYANLCKLKVEMSMHHAYDKSWKTMGDISNYNPQQNDMSLTQKTSRGSQGMSEGYRTTKITKLPGWVLQKHRTYNHDTCKNISYTTILYIIIQYIYIIYIYIIYNIYKIYNIYNIYIIYIIYKKIYNIYNIYIIYIISIIYIIYIYIIYNI